LFLIEHLLYFCFEAKEIFVEARNISRENILQALFMIESDALPLYTINCSLIKIFESSNLVPLTAYRPAFPLFLGKRLAPSSEKQTVRARKNNRPL